MQQYAATPIKIVNKPWGYEEWLEVNERYCVKRLTIRQGKRLSLQYHNVKVETLVVVKGLAVLIIDKNFQETRKPGDLSELYLKPGDFITIVPGQVHRLWAKRTDVIIIEASTPELDDVVRLDDDYNRGNT